MRSRSAECCSSLLWALGLAAAVMCLGAGEATAQTTVGTVNAGLAAAGDAAAQGSSPPLVAIPQPIPVQPRSPTAAKAYLVLETYCARCHQAGRAGTRPSDQRSSDARPTDPRPTDLGLANILDLDEIARVPSLVRPGHPDGSEIYVRLLRQHAATVPEDDRPPALPTPSDVEAVRDWIQGLAAGGAGAPAAAAGAGAGCAQRSPMGHAAIGRATAQWLSAVGAEQARDTRFVSLAHLYDACASEADLAGYRQAVTKTLNLLSWSEAPVRPEVVGDQLALMAVRLSELGWVAAHWERIAAAAPAGAAPDMPATVTEATGTAMPVVRGDWLAGAALRSPLYSELLALPPTLGEIARLIKAGPLAPKGAKSRRLAVRASTVVRGQRIVDRIAAGERPAWIAYDLAASGEGRDVFEAPLALGGAGPAAAGAGAGRGADLRAETQRLLFTLPNGLPAFAAFDHDGARIDAAPGGLARDAIAASGGTLVASGCLACHGQGPVAARDDMRAHLEGERSTLDREAKEAALRLYMTGDEARHTFAADAQRTRTALVRAALDPDLAVHGLEPTRALARQHDLPVGIERAAAEFGAPLASFAEHLKSYDGPAELQALAMRLLQGLLDRREAEVLYGALRGGKGAVAVSSGALPVPMSLPTAPARAASKAPSASAAVAAPLAAASSAERAEPVRVKLWSERPRYAAGELLALNVATSADCQLTLVGVDAKGKATVLFPNDFEQDNLVRGGRTLRFPARDGAYQLRLSEKGTETLIGICDPVEKQPLGMQHDFERQRFTVLGNWRNFLRGSIESAAEERRDPERASRSRSRRVAQARGENRTESRADQAPRSEGPGGDWAWAAIQVPVD